MCGGPSRRKGQGERGVGTRRIGTTSGEKTGRCFLYDGGDLVDGNVGEGPVAGLDDVANGREEGFVVAGPQLGTKDDVLELGAVGNLQR